MNGGAWSKLPAWAPSLVANYMEPPKPIEHHEIASVIDGFARSAANCAAGGLDGVEIHAAHGYLIHEFLSPHSNHRTDEYGGDLEGRMRFCVEVLEAVRAAVGSTVAVGVRLVGDEETRDGSGLGPEDAGGDRGPARGARAGRLRERERRDVGHGDGAAAVRTAPAWRRGDAHRTRRALGHAGVRRSPRADAGRGRGDRRRRRGRRGHARARAHRRSGLAGRRRATGRADEIRLCTGCNQGCYGNLTAGLPITCVTNPVTGRESTPRRSAAPGRGSEAGGRDRRRAGWARSRLGGAAARGHDVVLLERSRRARRQDPARRRAARARGAGRLRGLAGRRVRAPGRRHPARASRRRSTRCSRSNRTR